MTERCISPAVIRRLPRYYRYLGELLEANVERISSGELSRKMHVTASQIRQDLNNFGGFGQQGYGYNVKYLYEEIGKILGLDRDHNIVVVGIGHLGQAIANYKGFEQMGFKLTGLFDVNPELKKLKIRGVSVRMMDEFPDFMKNNNVDIVALTVPKDIAEATARILVDNGVRYIWNFALTDLDIFPDVIVENVHLSDSLMRLSFLAK